MKKKITICLLVLGFLIGLLGFMVPQNDHTPIVWAEIKGVGSITFDVPVWSDSKIRMYFTYEARNHLTIEHQKDGHNLKSLRERQALIYTFKAAAQFRTDTKAIYVAKDTQVMLSISEGRIQLRNLTGEHAATDLFNEPLLMGESVFFEVLLDELHPLISHELVIINNLDHPYTIDEIRKISKLTAIDSIDGDISEKITVIKDDYTPNRHLLGDFEITFSVTNSVNLTSQTTIIIANCDLTKPVVIGPSETTISYTEALDISEIVNKYQVSDNYDKSVQLELLSSNYINQLGVYTLVFEATDQSGNQTIVNHKVIVVDDVKPYFDDQSQGKIQFSFREHIQNEDLLINLFAYDEIDGDLTNQIKIIYHEVVSGKVGEYIVKYQVTDQAGNQANYERIVQIISTEHPIFYIDAKIMKIGNKDSLTKEQLVKLISEYEKIVYLDYRIIQNEYSGFENQVGSYLITVEYLTKNQEIYQVKRVIEVFSVNDSSDINHTLSIIIGFVGIGLIGSGIIAVCMIRKKKTTSA